jgi:hypothetical protein
MSMYLNPFTLLQASLSFFHSFKLIKISSYVFLSSILELPFFFLICRNASLSLLSIMSIFHPPLLSILLELNLFFTLFVFAFNVIIFKPTHTTSSFFLILSFIHFFSSLLEFHPLSFFLVYDKFFFLSLFYQNFSFSLTFILLAFSVSISEPRHTVSGFSISLLKTY